MSILLYGPNTATLAVVVLNIQQLGDPTVTAALAVLLTGLMALAAVPVVVGRRVLDGRRAVDRPVVRE
jgi:ABC-type Fe3+ transport system permease subunit